MDSAAIPVESGETPQKMRKFVMYFLRLGTFGFGGPIALAGHMQKDLVEERKWVSSQDYVEGLAFSQLSPGPLAAQLAMYLGWVRFGTLGATLTGGLAGITVARSMSFACAPITGQQRSSQSPLAKLGIDFDCRYRRDISRCGWRACRGIIRLQDF